MTSHDVDSCGFVFSHEKNQQNMHCVDQNIIDITVINMFFYSKMTIFATSLSNIAPMSSLSSTIDHGQGQGFGLRVSGIAR